MKTRLLMGAMVLMFAACATDPAATPDAPNGNEGGTTLNPAALTIIKSNQQARIVTPAKSGRAITRATVSDPAVPQIPAGALEFDKNTMSNYNDGVQLSTGNTYQITAPYSGSVSGAGETGEINVYVAADAEFKTWWESGVKINVYILPGATVTWSEAGNDDKAKIPYNTTIYCWGNLTTPDRLGLRLYNNGETGGNLYLYSSEEDSSIFTVKKAENPYYNDEKTKVTFQVDPGCEFYCSRVAVIDGSALFDGGTSTFANDVTINGNLWPQNDAVINFPACTHIHGQIDDSSARGATINVSEYLYCKSLYSNGGTLTINLNEALFDIDCDFSTVWNYLENRIVDKGNVFKFVGSKGNFYSVVRMVNNAELLIDQGNTYGHDNDAVTEFELHNFDGYVNFIGTLKVKEYWDTPWDLSLNNDNLVKPETVLINDDAVFLPGTTCRPQIGVGVIIEAPEHKYSATSIDFDEEGTLYLSWHSNLYADATPDHDHQHGTNADSEDYQPSVDGPEDWGGIIDVINTGNYDPESHLFEKSVMQQEHKYNHVKYYDGNLYLATTSRAVRAALHVLPTTLQEGEVGFRANLTGGSANCAEIVGGQVITISGRKSGGINYFSLDAIDEATKAYNESETASSNKWMNGPRMNVEKAYINADTLNFGGKYIYYDGKQIITLNNTDNATVTIYDDTMNEKSHFSTGIALEPNDGKNVLIAKNGLIYICCGQNGLFVYDYTGKQVGKCEGYSANGLDVDEAGRMFVATGAGLVVFDPETTLENGDYKAIAYRQYTGTGFKYPGSSSIQQSNNVKQSSNFVRLHGGNAYVAYGMYGLRIYPIADLIPPTETK